MTTPEAPPEPIVAQHAVALPAISVVMCTYNRADLLPAAIEHMLGQDHPETPSFELIIVDNNSADATSEVLERASARDNRVRCVREEEPGVSHARNTGISAARAPIVAFSDDDVRVDRGWLASIARAFAANPGACVVGGRVQPVWPTAPPAWLTTAHWGPLALVDHGPAPIRVDAANPLCLVGANLAVFRSVLDAIGGFRADVQRVKDSVGSSEDHEFLLRFYRTGGFGFYDPTIVVHAPVQPQRLERAYHRRWHEGHGHFHALMRAEYLERSNRGRVFDVPVHMYRAAIVDTLEWIRATLRRDDAEAFARELRLRFFLGFFRTRRGQYRSLSPAQRRLHWRQLARGLVGRRTESPELTASVGGR